jgi:hypothetical protein
MSSQIRRRQLDGEVVDEIALAPVRDLVDDALGVRADLRLGPGSCAA